VLAASSLVLGAVLGVVRTWSDRIVGYVLAFGAGALIAAVSFELTEEGLELGSLGTVAIGLAAGALTYFTLDHLLESPSRAGASGTGTSLLLGASLDGIPEQLVLGIGLAGGAGVGISLLVAIFVSNLPEAIGSATGMKADGDPTAVILRRWILVAAVCAVSTLVGYAVADSLGGDGRALLDGFAAGGLLVMLTDSMIPEARDKAGRPAGLVTVLGFAAAAGLSTIS
jgi:ZIP family zinc transporter